MTKNGENRRPCTTERIGRSDQVKHSIDDVALLGLVSEIVVRFSCQRQLKENRSLRMPGQKNKELCVPRCARINAKSLDVSLILPMVRSLQVYGMHDCWFCQGAKSNRGSQGEG